MRLLPALIGLLMPACASEGVSGLPVPPPMQLAGLQRPASPNTALAAPAGFLPTPDIVTRTYAVPPDRLYAAIRGVAEAQPRTFLAATYNDRRQVHYVVRSAVLNFPDLVTAEVDADSTLILWSRSVYGESDLGVNAKRLTAWLAALDAALLTSH